jgi:aspartate aminotransferase
MGTRISDRIAAIAESATLAVDAKAKALKAAGRPVIGFGAGEPDFATPDYIVRAAVEAAQQPRYHRYTPVAGLPELREAVAAKTLRDSGYAVEPSQVLITNGGKQAVYNTFATLLDPGDEVLLIAPYWTTYPEAVKLAGGVPVEVQTAPAWSSWRQPAPHAPRCCCSCPRPTPQARCTRPSRSRRSAPGRPGTASGW